MSNFGFIAGSVPLDLVNTVHWRLDVERRFDALESHKDFLTWSMLAGVLDQEESNRLRELAKAHPLLAENAVTEARQVRELLHAAVTRADPGSVSELIHLFRAGLQRAELVPGPDCWGWSDSMLLLATPTDRITRLAVDLLTRPSAGVVKQCADGACGWLYLDASRGGNRRWCSATGCGDRNRARQHYRRRSTQATQALKGRAPRSTRS